MRTNWQEVTDLQLLRSTCQLYESVLRGECGVVLEDGYTINVAALRDRIRGYESWERSVNEALNSGDGSYRP